MLWVIIIIVVDNNNLGYKLQNTLLLLCTFFHLIYNSPCQNTDENKSPMIFDNFDDGKCDSPLQNGVMHPLVSVWPWTTPFVLLLPVYM